MGAWTTVEQRQAFYQRHQSGETYRQIADTYGVSKGCVRYWCRHQRDGGDCQTQHSQPRRGLLSQFDPKVRYCVLRLRLERPRWGPKSILNRMEKRPSLRGMRLPSTASIGRYLHQWPRFRRRPKVKHERKRPNQPREVHQRWQLDFKVKIDLEDGTQVNLHTARDPVGEACIGARIFAAGKVGEPAKRVQLENTMWFLRTCFATWDTLPDEIQTDGEPVLIGRAGEHFFPSRFTLWLKGLGIDHLVIRSGKPTDNAEVERCHRTVNDYAIVGNEGLAVKQLNNVLQEAVRELAYELPSRAKGCDGQTPVKAHPELLAPRHPYQPDHELALFDLRRVDAYLATFTWRRIAGKTGQVQVGTRRRRYSIGRTYARQEVLVRFDPADRHFVFSTVHEPDRQIARRPARGLELADITGLAEWPLGIGPQQLPLPWPKLEGVNC